MRGERELEKYEEERDARGSAREIRERESEKDRDEKERNAEMREREMKTVPSPEIAACLLTPFFAAPEYSTPGSMRLPRSFDAISLDGRAVDVLRSTRHH